MKNSLRCCKCGSKNIKKIKALPIQLRFGIVQTKYFSPNYYICCECGYSEIWGETKDELEFIKNRKHR